MNSETLNEDAEARKEGDVALRFRGGPALSVRGPVTERVYRFSEEKPVQPVDARDVVSIVNTGLFRQVL